jgi:hypothetical protein
MGDEQGLFVRWPTSACFARGSFGDCRISLASPALIRYTASLSVLTALRCEDVFELGDKSSNSHAFASLEFGLAVASTSYNFAKYDILLHLGFHCVERGRQNDCLQCPMGDHFISVWSRRVVFRTVTGTSH